MNGKNKFIILVLLTSLALITNFLAVSLPLNGRTTQELSDNFPVLVTPAGYVFSIWGVIYLLMILFLVFFNKYKNDNSKFLKNLFILQCTAHAANALWIVVWHYENIILSFIVMFVLLAALIFSYVNVRKFISDKKRGIVEHSALIYSGIYLSWIVIASVVNTAVLLYSLGVRELLFSNEVWAVILIFTAGTISLFFYLKFKDLFFQLVTIWAVAGIAAKQDSQTIGAAVAMVLGFMITFLVFNEVRVRFRR